MATTNPYPPQDPREPQAVAALSDAWVGTLAQGLHLAPDSVLSPTSAIAIKARLMQRIGAPPATQANANTGSGALADGKVVSILRDEAWVSLSKKIQVKVLHDDGSTLSWLLRLLPGGRLPQHDHADGLEECLVLEGQLRINGDMFGTGDYQIAHPGSVHFEVASDTGALVFLKSPSSRRKDLAPA
jgi:anti-sigma factor ChrR (cupin superfamily)